MTTFAQTDNVAWTLPIDDTTTRIFTAFRMAAGADVTWLSKVKDAPMYGGKSWYQLDDEGHQRFPGDYEAQVGQGTDHASFGRAACRQRSRRRHVSALYKRGIRQSPRGSTRSASPAPTTPRSCGCRRGTSSCNRAQLLTEINFTPA